MLPLIGKKMVVIGGSRGVGRRIVEAGIRNGARVPAAPLSQGRRILEGMPEPNAPSYS